MTTPPILLQFHDLPDCGDAVASILAVRGKFPQRDGQTWHWVRTGQGPSRADHGCSEPLATDGPPFLACACDTLPGGGLLQPRQAQKGATVQPGCDWNMPLGRERPWFGLPTLICRAKAVLFRARQGLPGRGDRRACTSHAHLAGARLLSKMIRELSEPSRSIRREPGCRFHGKRTRTWRPCFEQQISKCTRSGPVHGPAGVCAGGGNRSISNIWGLHVHHFESVDKMRMPLDRLRFGCHHLGYALPYSTRKQDPLSSSTLLHTHRGTLMSSSRLCRDAALPAGGFKSL